MEWVEGWLGRKEEGEMPRLRCLRMVAEQGDL